MEKETSFGFGDVSFFRVILHGKFVNMTYFLTQLIGIFSYFRIDKFGIYLCGKNGFMPQYFLKGFQRHPFEDSQNCESVAPDMRGDFGPAIAFFAYDSETEKHGIVFTYRKDTIGRVFLFIHASVFFYQFDGNRQ